MDLFVNLLTLVLVGGIPYFYLSESKKQMMFFTVHLFFAVGVYLIVSQKIDFHLYYIIITIASSLFALYKASKTKNFYALSYLFIFINAPVFIALDASYIGWYGASLALSSIGIYFIGRFFEQNYGSANFHNIKSLVIKTPHIAVFLRMYLVNVTLFPPLPSSIFILMALVDTPLSPSVIVAFGVVFIANLLIGMRVLTSVLFGEENRTVKYIDFQSKDLLFHSSLMLVVILLALYALKGALL